MTKEQRRRYAIATRAINEIARGAETHTRFCLPSDNCVKDCPVRVARRAQLKMRKKP